MNAILMLTLALMPGDAPLVSARPVIDLGQVRGGPALTQSFTIANRGDREIQIVHAQPSCGCLAPKFSQHVLKPGESASVEVHIGTISQPEGENLWSVRLYYRVAGADTNHTLDLQVRANLVSEVSLQPSALRLSGRPGLSHEITLTDRRAKPLELLGATSATGRLQVRVEEPWQRTEAGWVRKVKLTISDDCPAGRSEDVVQLVSNDPDYREMRVPITVVRTDRNRYVVTPAELKLSPMAGAESIVLIRDRGGQPVEIEKVETDDPALTARFVPGAQNTAAVRVSVGPGASPGRWANLRVRIKSPQPKELLIPVAVNP